MSSNGYVCKCTDHILLYKKRHSSTLDLSSYNTYCEPDYCIVVSKSRERLLVTSEEVQKFYVEIFNLKEPKHVKLRSSTVDSHIIDINRTKL